MCYFRDIFSVEEFSAEDLSVKDLCQRISRLSAQDLNGDSLHSQGISWQRISRRKSLSYRESLLPGRNIYRPRIFSSSPDEELLTVLWGYIFSRHIFTSFPAKDLSTVLWEDDLSAEGFSAAAVLFFLGITSSCGDLGGSLPSHRQIFRQRFSSVRISML